MKKMLTSFITRQCMLLLATLLNVGVFAQDVSVGGKVTASDGEILPGVSVYQKGNLANGTLTDASGAYRLNVSKGTAVVFSFVGYRTLEKTAAPVLNVVLKEDVSNLSEVFVTATSQPVRKIETVTAVESISAKELARLSPINLPDAIRYTPGVYVQTQAGRTRNSIFVRGFPDVVGNGLGYTSLLQDGLRTFASPEMVPDAAMRYDLNIGKIEVVRGSAATLFGRGAVAGAVNVISRVGGEEMSGTLRMTLSNNDMRQFDLNINGPLNAAKTLRYNLGGFLLRDKGYRDNLFPDEGGQFRGNIDYLIPDNKGSIKLTAGYVDLNVQNQLDIPYSPTDLSKPALGWSTRNTVMPRAVYEGRIVPLTYPNGTVENVDLADFTKRGNFSKGGNVGLQFDLNLGNGWSLINKGRWQQITVGIGFDFALSTTYGAGVDGAVYASRAAFGGGITGGGSNATDFIDEVRLNKTAQIGKSKHSFTAGYYYSTINVKVASRGLLYGNIIKPNGVSEIAPYRLLGASPLGVPPAAPSLPTIPSLFRNGDYTETVNSFFAGDEMKIGDKLTINAGIRHDIIKMDLIEDRYAFQRLARRTPEHSGTSGSVGFNYLFNDNTALYGNFVSAYRAPDYGAYTSVQYAFRTPTNPTPTLYNPATAPANAILTDEKGRTLYLAPYIDDNEVINSVEVGLRKSFGDFNFDGGVFYNTIKNRLVSTFVGALAVSVPGGDNRTVGTELSVSWFPSAIKGLSARTSLTIQDAIYTKLVQSFTFAGDLSLPYNSRQEVSRNATTGLSTYIYNVDVAGKRSANMPRSIWNTNVAYDGKRVGANFGINYLGSRPTDPFNTVDYAAYALVDANLYLNIPVAKGSNARFKLSGYNLGNNQSVANIISAVTDNYLYLGKSVNFQGNSAYVRGVPIIPRRIMFSVELTF